MDRPCLLTGAGLPFRFDSLETGGEVRSGVPANRQPFTVPGAAAEKSTTRYNAITQASPAADAGRAVS